MNHLQKIVIVGGGTSGWMTAAALSTVLRGKYSIELVESDEIGTVGVGEATIPMIQRFNSIVGINEVDFVKETNGSFKLGIEFVNWGRLGDRYMHGFGSIGQDLWTVRFEQYWHKMHRLGKAADLAKYSITRSAALRNKFMHPRHDVENSPLSDIAYAYHFDASLYAKFLRKLSVERGVIRTEGRISRTHQRPIDGYITDVELENGTKISGDLFIDCSGFKGLLIEETLQTGYLDWTHWLPCDRAIAVPCGSASSLTPYTRSTAHEAGWQWRIPLQHRTGNGHVYCSQYMSEDEATNKLLQTLDGKPLADPRQIKFKTGMRKKAWNKNVVAIGLSSGFLEPLESTSIHLIQSTISQLIEFFPHAGFDSIEIDEFNRQHEFHFERIRDFIILHYHVNQRTDSEFWKACANMAIPDTLRHKLDIYKASGRVQRVDGELFTEVGWAQVMIGQNLQPNNYHPLVDLQSEENIANYLQSVEDVISKCVEIMPDHKDYIAKYFAAAKSSMQ